MNERECDTTAAFVGPVAWEDVELLEHLVGGEPPLKHRRRYQLQLGGSVTYLAAWLGAVPAGHLLIRWTGSSDREAVRVLRRAPILEDLLVLPQHRRLGLGRLLLEEAEAQAVLRGCARIGLAVGLTPDYEAARRLYLRRGFRSEGFSSRYAGYWTRDAQGVSIWCEEAVEYLARDFNGGECG